MTRAEMHIAFDLELDKTSNLTNPSYEPEEKDFWLNSAISKFVKTRYSGFNVKKKGFEQDQKRIDDLRTLVKEKTIDSLTISSTKPNAFIADLTSLTISGVPDTDVYMFTVSEEVTITFDSNTTNDILKKSTGLRQGVTEVTANNYRSHIDNPYSEHVLHYEKAKPLRLFLGNTVELITDGNYKVTEYHIRYIAKPQVISSSVDCDLPDTVHDEIVKIAVNMALENIEQPRYQSHLNELNTIE